MTFDPMSRGVPGAYDLLQGTRGVLPPSESAERTRPRRTFGHRGVVATGTILSKHYASYTIITILVHFVSLNSRTDDALNVAAS